MSNFRCATIVVGFCYFLLSCSAKKESNNCASINSDVGYSKKIGPVALEKYLLNKDAAGGELVVEFRKDEILGSPSHQKSCSFFIEPSTISNSGGLLWTASHCLDLSRDSKYRLRFYIDLATGYFDIPVTIPALEKISVFRARLEKQFPAALQREILSSFQPPQINFGASKNATDICLNSLASGRTLFHEPLPGKNQVSCFLYQDLRLVEFRLPSNLTIEQSQVIEFMFERSRMNLFWSPVTGTAVVSTPGKSVQFSDLRQDWIESYKNYLKLHEQVEFKNWLQGVQNGCISEGASGSTALCGQLEALRSLLKESGLESEQSLFDKGQFEAFDAAYKTSRSKIVDLWNLIEKGQVTFDNGTTMRTWGNMGLLSNYSWNASNLRTFSALSTFLFEGVGFGNTIGADGVSRSRVGMASYNWNATAEDVFIYGIFPKTQPVDNLESGFFQLRLMPGDSGSMLLALGLPMAVLATVDGEKTSGGSTILPLPEVPAEPSTVAQISTGGELDSRGTLPASQSAGCAK
ncbi:hypothetical protein EBR21_03520 [bacterium]|nr:hypothetical protein [bacterium]